MTPVTATPIQSRALRLSVAGAGTVGARFETPAAASAGFVFAHGAGAGMDHPFMTAFATGLHARGIATLRFQFPYMERGSRRVDSHGVAEDTVHAAVAEANRLLPGLPLLAGGKSYGGRMTSRAAAASPLPGVVGLVFVGFPLHSAERPGVERAAHLAAVALPMLFLQGTRDDLADLALLRPVLASLGGRASLATFDDADHGFHVRVASGSTDSLTRVAMLDTVVSWSRTLPGVAASG
ncbi:MAG: alpha/beta hydrolase [Pseudomonadota bacterium]|nr:alpha/beta hydrolase [Pseudomonadota bacterium]